LNSIVINANYIIPVLTRLN